MAFFQLLPAKARRWVYGVASLLLLAYGAWEVAHGDVVQAVVSLLTSVVSGMAHANVTPDQDEGSGQ
jgi:hypothetical protein